MLGRFLSAPATATCPASPITGFRVSGDAGPCLRYVLHRLMAYRPICMVIFFIVAFCHRFIYEYRYGYEMYNVAATGSAVGAPTTDKWQDYSDRRNLDRCLRQLMHVVVDINDVPERVKFKLVSMVHIFIRSYLVRSRLCIQCCVRLSSSVRVYYCGQTVRPSAKVTIDGL